MKLGDLLKNKKLFEVNYSLDLGGIPQEGLFKKYSQADFSKYSVRKELLAEMFKSLFVPDSRATGVFHPSEISQESGLCNRKLYYQIARVSVDASYIPLGGEANNRLQRVFDLGTLIHWYIQINLLVNGYLLDFEIPVEALEFSISGKTDGEVINVPDLPEGEVAILEIKSINDRGFMSLNGPKKEHINQASIYASLRNRKYIFFVYYNKNTSDIKYYTSPVNNQFVDFFKELATGIRLSYRKNKLKYGSAIKKHEVSPRVCRNMSVEQAHDCPFCEFCFSY